MIYLNRTAYNGLYRVNHKGQFNTPFGAYKALSLPSSEVILTASRALQRVKLKTGDFEIVLNEHAAAGDLVYLDPPYPAVSKYSDFNRYTKDYFDESDHRRLSACVKELDEKGCNFILSNADHPLIRELYTDEKFKILETSAPRYINCKGNRRGNVAELLVTNCKPAS
jgi:DNA adenine methylase